MNNVRRKELKNTLDMLENISNTLSSILDEESDCLGNMPENLQNSIRYENMEDAVELLGDAVDSIESVKENIEEAMR